MSFACKRNDRFNAEGYADPTAYAAIKNIEKSTTVDPHLYSYTRKKLHMLMFEFFINPTIEEVDMLFNLTNEQSIDRAAVNIIKKHWQID